MINYSYRLQKPMYRMIVLLEYIDLFQSKWQHETIINFGRGCPLFTILYCRIYGYYSYLSAFCSYHASILLFAFAFLFF